MNEPETELAQLLLLQVTQFRPAERTRKPKIVREKHGAKINV